VTSRYCCYYGRYPFTNHPADGNGHHFFDHAGGSLIELRADGSATLSEVDASGVFDPAVLTCGAFRLDWKGSNKELVARVRTAAEPLLWTA
jgi:hypothetical protein